MYPVFSSTYRAGVYIYMYPVYSKLSCLLGTFVCTLTRRTTRCGSFGCVGCLSPPSPRAVLDAGPVIVDMIGTLRPALYAVMRQTGTGVTHDEAEDPPMTVDECMGFCALVFDQDKDGSIDVDEFFFMVEFVVVSNYLQNAAGGEAD